MDIRANQSFLNITSNLPQIRNNSNNEQTEKFQSLFEDMKFTEDSNTQLQQNYSDTDFFESVTKAVTDIITPFVQIFQQLLETITTGQTPKKSDENIPQEELQSGLQNSTLHISQTNSGYTITESNIANDNTAKIQADINALKQQQMELEAQKNNISNDYVFALNDNNTSNDAVAEAKYQYESMKINSQEVQINHQLSLLNEALIASQATSQNPQVQELLDKKAELLSRKADITKDYTSALNDTTLTFNHYTDSNGTVEVTAKELTYENFCNMLDSQYRLINPKTGKILCLNTNESKKYNTSTNNMEVVPDLRNKTYFQELLQSGQVIIQKNEQFRTHKMWNAIDFNSIPNINTTYNTDNDAAAEANYQHQLLQIESELSIINVQLKNAEKTPLNPSSDNLQAGLKEGFLHITKTNNRFTLNEQTTTQNQTTENKQNTYIERQIERYEKYIEKYEKQIEILEAGNDSNKEAKIASFEQKIEKYMNKIQELID